MGQLYKLSFPSGKSYIGITSQTAEARLRSHWRCRKKGTPISNALMKHGLNSVSMSVLADSEDWGLLCEMEKIAIVEHDTRYPHGYNLTVGGEGVTSRSEEEIERMMVAARRPERVAKIGEASRRHWGDPIASAAHAQAIRDRWKDAEWRTTRLKGHALLLRARNSDPSWIDGLTRRMRGAGNPQSKLSIEDVLDVCARISAGVTNKAIAEHFKVDATTISLIKCGKKWGWLTGITPTDRTQEAA